LGGGGGGNSSTPTRARALRCFLSFWKLVSACVESFYVILMLDSLEWCVVLHPVIWGSSIVSSCVGHFGKLRSYGVVSFWQFTSSGFVPFWKCVSSCWCYAGNLTALAFDHIVHTFFDPPCFSLGNEHGGHVVAPISYLARNTRGDKFTPVLNNPNTRGDK